MATPEFHLSARKPLQPKNTNAANVNLVAAVKDGSKTNQLNAKPKQDLRLDNVSNKENLSFHHHHHHDHPIAVFTTPTKKKIEAAELDLDSSLAEELSAMRKRLERLRFDKEKTEKMLKERDDILDSQLKEMEDKGRFQKQLEIEVDRLFRLKELKSYCMRISPIKSLRERQQGGRKNNNGVQSLDIKAAEWEEESMDENTLQSPTPSDSSEFVGENNND